MKKKKAFTLAEAILTMTILGIIAAIMIATLKPSQYKSQGFLVLKQKLYTEIDNITQTISIECTDGMDLSKIYTNTSDYTSCVKSLSTATFGPSTAYKYANYIRGTRNSASCAATSVTEKKIDGSASAAKSYTQAAGIKLKNGACIWVRAIASSETGYYNADTRIGSILIDVNGAEGPNSIGDGDDRMVFYVGKNGIETDMPEN